MQGSERLGPVHAVSSTCPLFILKASWFTLSISLCMLLDGGEGGGGGPTRGKRHF